MRSWRRYLVLSAWPIAAKLSAALFLLALLPMVCTAYFSLRQSLSSLEDTEYRNLELLATSTANRLDQLLIDSQRVVNEASGDNEVIEFMQNPAPARDRYRASVQLTLNNIKRSNANYDDVYLLDKSGACVLSTKAMMVGEHFTFRPYFKEALRGRPYISEILVGTVTKQPGIYFSDTVRSSTGQAMGVGVIKMKAETIAQMVSALKVGPQGDTFLIDQDGVIISHPDPAFLYHSLAPLPPETLRRIVSEKRFAIDQIESLGLPQLMRTMVGARESGHSRYHLAARGAWQIVGYAPVSRHRWVVAVSEPLEQFASPLRRLARRIDLIVLSMAIFVVLISWLLARSITRPVRELTRAAQAVAKGDFDAGKVRIRSSDEIGVLSMTFNAMALGLKERQRERDIFGRVLSPEVREKLLSSTLELGGETRRVSVLLSDIRGFSTISECMNPQEVVALLNEYLTEMTAAVRPFGGYVNNFIGDAIVVIFGAPLDQPGAEYCAVAAGMTMKERLKGLNQRRVARGEQALENGIGISTGEAVAGQIGSRERLQYTVIGDIVNISARLEALTKDYPEYPVLMNEATASALRDREDITLKSLGLIKVKGRTEPVDVFAVVSWRKPEAQQSAA